MKMHGTNGGSRSRRAVKNSRKLGAAIIAVIAALAVTAPATASTWRPFNAAAITPTYAPVVLVAPGTSATVPDVSWSDVSWSDAL